MEIVKTIEDGVCKLQLIGRLDTNTVSLLEEELNEVFKENIKGLVFDFEKLEYISSAGLRVLLACQKKNSEPGQMILRNVNGDIMEVFGMTGFLDILTLE